jgi:hypothetical protein
MFKAFPKDGSFLVSAITTTGFATLLQCTGMMSHNCMLKRYSSQVIQLASSLHNVINPTQSASVHKFYMLISFHICISNSLPALAFVHPLR